MFFIPVLDLKDQSLITLTLPQKYGYCILIAVGSMVVIQWERKRISQKRLTYDFQHAEDEISKSEIFSSSTVHQDILEEYPQFLVLLLLGGLDSPGTSAIGGTLYTLTRVVSTVSCCKGDSVKRGCQALGYLGWVAMVASTARLAMRLLRVI